MESSPNLLFDLFHRTLTKKSSLLLLTELDEMRNNFTGKVIPINFITEFHCNLEGDTALQVAAKSKRYDVVEFLVRQLKSHITEDLCLEVKKCPFSWEKVDCFSVLPSQFVLPSPEIAIISVISNQVPVIYLIEYLVDVVNDKIFWMDFVLNSFMASSITRQEKINALELMGAAFIFKRILDTTGRREYESEEVELWRGLLCWKQAMALRNSTADGGPALPKIPCHLSSDIARRAFGKSVEITTQEELEQLEKQSSHHDSLNDWLVICGSLQIQALLVIQRNVFQMTSKPPDSPNSFYLEYLLYYAHYCCNSLKQYHSAINICLHILEQSNGFNSNLSPKCIDIFAEMFHLVLECFKQIDRDPQNGLLPQELSFVSLFLPIKSGLAITSDLLPVPPVALAIPQLFDIMEDIFFFISNWLPWLTQYEIEQLTEDLARYIHFYNLNHGVTSLLHVAVEMIDARCDSLFHSRQAVPIAHLFFKVANSSEADREAETNNGTEFRSISMEKCSPKKNSQSYLIVFQILLEAGEHFDRATFQDDETIVLKRIKHPVVGFRLDPFLDPLIDSVLPLACYCATVIGQLEISFESKIPSTLHSYVRGHSSLKGINTDAMTFIEPL